MIKVLEFSQTQLTLQQIASNKNQLIQILCWTLLVIEEDFVMMK